jgi:hypothetical protein
MPGLRAQVELLSCQHPRLCGDEHPPLPHASFALGDVLMNWSVTAREQRGNADRAGKRLQVHASHSETCDA